MRFGTFPQRPLRIEWYKQTRQFVRQLSEKSNEKPIRMYVNEMYRSPQACPEERKNKYLNGLGQVLEK